MMTGVITVLLFAAGQAPPAAAPAAVPPPVTPAPAVPAVSAPVPPPSPAGVNDPPACEKKPEKEEHVPKAGPLFCKWLSYMKDGFTDTKWPGDPEPEEEGAEPKRRALPEPWSSPPFPMHEFQGYPLPGVPPEEASYPLEMALHDWSDFFKENRIRVYGWVTGSFNSSTNKTSNAPTSYWVVPNRLELDQFVLKVEREVDSVQTDHWDWGFRSSVIYGLDYRYTTALGWASDQLLVHNLQYGWDPLEQYFDVYIPGIAKGTIVRVGRWVACPDIETQLAPDNYLGSHSILFTYDTYTQTGFMVTTKLSDNWMVQGGLNAGNDMAPWTQGAQPCGYAAVRWVADDNKNAVYAVLNQINSARFRHFTYNGLPTGHDNFNYFVATYEHVFNAKFHTKTEGYFMWQKDAELGGTPSLGPVKPIGGGGGDGITLPGTSLTYGLLNYTMYAISNKDFITFRNEVWRDERGMRSGFPGTYTSHTIGITHNINKLLQVRPEVGYYRNWENPAFDLGKANGCWIAGVDCTLRF